MFARHAAAARTSALPALMSARQQPAHASTHSEANMGGAGDLRGARAGLRKRLRFLRGLQLFELVLGLATLDDQLASTCSRPFQWHDKLRQPKPSPRTRGGPRRFGLVLRIYCWPTQEQRGCVSLIASPVSSGNTLKCRRLSTRSQVTPGRGMITFAIPDPNSLFDRGQRERRTLRLRVNEYAPRSMSTTLA